MSSDCQEAEALQREVALLASELNKFHRLRLIRAFDEYRKFRSSFVERLFRLRVNKARPTALADIGLPPPDSQKYDVIFMSCADWQWRHQRPQHLARQWAENGHRVFFVSLDFRRDVNPRYQKSPGPYGFRSVSDNIWEIHLAGDWRLDPQGVRMTSAECTDLLKSFECLAHDFQIRDAFQVLEFPFWRPLAVALRRHYGWKMAYDLVDRWYGILSNSHSVLSEEDLLIREADLVVVTAQLLRDQIKGQNACIRVIPNGADVEHFGQCGNRVSPVTRDLTAPVIGYFGNLAAWLDVDLVESVAARHPGWTFLFIGHGKANLDSVKKLPNVTFIGEVAYPVLPTYLRKVDAYIIPFKLLPVTATTDPVKFYEYLATGKPVVSTNLPELQAHRDFVYLAGTAEEFSQCLERAVSDDRPECQEKRKAYASRFSWRNRFLAFDKALRELDDHPTSSQPRCQADGPTSPTLRSVEPESVRQYHFGPAPSMPAIPLTLRGERFTDQCIALIDEQPIKTHFICPSELQCSLPDTFLQSPGCFMISVLDRNTWMQSNRRIFLIHGA